MLHCAADNGDELTRVVMLDGHEVAYRLKKSSRARMVRLQVRVDSGLTVVVPRGFSLRDLEPFLHRQRRWILRTLSRASNLAHSAVGATLKEGDPVPYLGDERTLELRRTESSCAVVEVRATSIVVTLREGSDGYLRDILRGWLKHQAKVLIPRKVQKLAATNGLAYNRITIRDQRSLWASCSHKRNLSFNWRLVMAPMEVMDYIVAHELAHLVEMNHSKRFWDIVQSWCPDYKQQKRWLRENEELLRLW